MIFHITRGLAGRVLALLIVRFGHLKQSGTALHISDLEPHEVDAVNVGSETAEVICR